MKKKFISMALSAVMAFSLAAASVSAAVSLNAGKPNGTISNTVQNGQQIKEDVTAYQYTPKDIYGDVFIEWQWQNVDLIHNPYASVEYYYEVPEEAANPAEEIKMMLCSVSAPGGQETWITNNSLADLVEVRTVVSPLKKNQWARAAFDFTPMVKKMQDAGMTNTIKRIRIYPFGDIKGNNLQNGSTIYIKSIQYDSVKPSEYVPKVYYDEAGKAYAYVSENGSVTIDGETIGAFQSVKSAFEALGDQEGATVYLSGTVSSFEDVSTRKNVLLRGLGDSEEEIAANVLNGFYKVTGGDITVDYLTLQGAPETSEPSLYSTGSTITIGKNVEVAGGKGSIFAGLGNGEKSLTKKRMMIFNGGTWQSVAAGTNYSGYPNGEVGGAVDYIFNDGLFYGVWGGSKESWEWSNTKVQGDVNFTFNGGSYSGSFYLGSEQHPCEVLGNITWNVNGGVWNSQKIIGGHLGLRTASGITTGTPLRNVAVLVNNQNLTKDSALNTLTLGREGDGINIGGKEIYIINHYEKNTGTKINPASTAAYRIHVTNGSAEPVYKSDVEYGGDLLGFRLTAEDETADLYINGVKTEKTADGVYEISENKTAGEITEIAFIKGGEGVLSVSEADGAVTAKVYSFDGEKNMMLLIGEFDGTRLTNAYIAEKAISGIDELTVNCTKTDGKTYRAYVWNSSMNPYMMTQLN